MYAIVEFTLKKEVAVTPLAWIKSGECRWQTMSRYSIGFLDGTWTNYSQYMKWPSANGQKKFARNLESARLLLPTQQGTSESVQKMLIDRKSVV